MRQPMPAAKFITDLGRKAEGASALVGGQEQTGLQALRLSSVRDGNTPEQRIARVRAEALAEAQAGALAEYEVKFEEQRAQFDQQLALERVTWASREADRLAELLTDGLAELERRIADSVAELLQPILVDATRRRAIDDLGRAIETLLVKDESVALEITGPEDLLQLLRQRMSGKNIALLFSPNDSPEVTVLARQTVLETQLAAWAATVEEALR
jgi:hypothetical protein